MDPDATQTTREDFGSSETRFQILRRHAKGGLGEVFVARDDELHREVALKVIQEPFADDAGSRERFLREAEITGRLEHPGIVPVYGLGLNSRGQPYYAMRFIRGVSLKEAINDYHRPAEDRAAGRTSKQDTLALRELLSRFLAACDAISYAHSRGILHRDLKPTNIMLGPFGETLVVDWGLAKPIGRPPDIDATPEGTLRPSSEDGFAATTYGAVHGTPSFMPPEQARGDIDHLGPASDVYGLGATLYYLLTGSRPFEGDRQTILANVVQGRFPSPRRLKPSIPVPLEAICLKAMRTAPAERYHSVAELTKDLKHWLADEPTAAYPESAADRLARWSRRHRTQTAAATVALLAVAVVSTAAAFTTLQALKNETNALGVASQSLEAERKATVAAQTNARLATGNLLTARKAIMGLLLRLAARELATIPQVEPLRAEVAKSAATLFDELLVSQPKDPDVRRDAAVIDREKANIARGRRAFDEAEPDYIRAITLVEGLVAELGRESDRALLASLLNDFGEALKMANRRVEAAERLGRGLDLLAGLREAHPDDVDLRRREAAGRVDLGVLLLDSGKTSDGAAQFQKAVDALAALAAVPSPALNDLLVLALARRGLGAAYQELGQNDQAWNAFEEGARPLLGRSDNNSRFLVATTRNRQAALRADDPKTRPEAERLYSETAETLGSLKREFPNFPAYKLQHAVALSGRGGVRLELEPAQTAEAEKDCTEALGILQEIAEKFASDPEYQGQLGLTLGRLSRTAQASGKDGEARDLRERSGNALRKAHELNPDNPRYKRWLDAHNQRRAG
jgi:serine/threonine protein kinase/tetratricopeptide (TPR) repeat protein